jgi:hypothetical protein
LSREIQQKYKSLSIAYISILIFRSNELKNV